MNIELEAKYYPDTTPSRSRGNPLAEALSPFPSDPTELANSLGRRPSVDFSKGFDSPSTFYEISNLLSIHKPRVESEYLALKIRSMIYRSYESQNPFAKETIKRLETLEDTSVYVEKSVPAISTQVDAMMLLASSGMGKSSMISSALRLLPQVITHNKFNGISWFQKQIVYLSIDAPVSASPKGLLLNICDAIDRALLAGDSNSVLASVSSSASVETLRVHVVKALAAHRVGLLHIDDIQRLSEGNKTLMLQAVALIISIANTCCCSLLFSGTPAALKVVQSNMESTRRILRRGSIMIPTPKSIEDPFFSGLVKQLLKHQICDESLPASAEIQELLLNMTAGIPGVLNSVVVTALERSYLFRRPLSAALLRDAFESQFEPIRSAIKTLNTLRKQSALDWRQDIDDEVSNHLKLMAA